MNRFLFLANGGAVRPISAGTAFKGLPKLAIFVFQIIIYGY